MTFSRRTLFFFFHPGPSGNKSQQSKRGNQPSTQANLLFFFLVLRFPPKSGPMGDLSGASLGKCGTARLGGLRGDPRVFSDARNAHGIRVWFQWCETEFFTIVEWSYQWILLLNRKLSIWSTTFSFWVILLMDKSCTSSCDVYTFLFARGRRIHQSFMPAQLVHTGRYQESINETDTPP